MTTAAFGPEAARWSARLGDLPAIVADSADAAHAFEAAVLARLAGDPRYISVLLDDQRSAIAYVLGAAVLEQQADRDMRHAFLDQIAAGTLPLADGQSQLSLSTIGAPVLTTLRHVYDIADNLLVRSWTEYERLQRLFGHSRPSVQRYAPLDSDVPPPASAGKRDAIVIWGPRRAARELGLLALAFDEMDTPVIIVSAGGSPPPLRNATNVSVAEGGAALGRALMIIDAELSDPGTALALAAHGVPVATSSTTGAHEYLDPAFVFDPWSWRSVFRAGMAALGCTRAARVSREAGLRPEAPPVPAPLLPADDAPLVSIVTPTYNRRDRIEACLRRWADQTYPNVEHVVVNDGGESIADIAARFPRARMIDLPANVGIAVALNHGVEAARGKYLVLAADDDEYSRDHVAQLAAALVRTGKSVSHTNTVIRHEHVVEGGGHVIAGYSLLWNTPLDRTTVLSGGVLALQSAMMTRDSFIEAGWYALDLPHARDYAMIAGLARRHDFVHVDTTTLIYGLRADPSSERFKHREHETTALRMIYERNPAPDRPAIAALRAHVIEHSIQKGSNMFNDPALRLIP